LVPHRLRRFGMTGGFGNGRFLAAEKRQLGMTAPPKNGSSE
jgi:hypothetical protein